MRYLCLVCFDNTIIDTLPPGEWDRLVKDSAEYDLELQRRGHFIAAEALMSPDTATTVRMRQGKISATDGPFAELKEQVAGFNPLLVGTAIDDCVAQQIHLLAQNDTGRFIEVKCTSGEGYVAQVKDDAVNQIYPCDRAQRIGGGCTLTRVAAPEAAAGQ